MDVNKQVPSVDTHVNDCQISSTSVSDTEGGMHSSVAGEPNGTALSFETLQQAVGKSLKRITSKQRILPYFKEHFRKVYQADSENVLEIFKSMMNQLESMIKEEIQMQLNACNVESLLGDLDKIKLEHVNSQRKWRPSGNPKGDIQAHLQESSEKEFQQLEKVLRALESQNKHLTEAVAKSDEKLLESLQKVEEHCSIWKEAALAMSDETRQDLIDINMNLPNMPT